MKHFVWHRTDGSIGGTFTMTNGVPDDMDPRNEQTTHPAAKQAHQDASSRMGFNGWVPYDCPCPPKGMCDCLAERVRDSYVEDGTLRQKPALEILVDGQPYQPGTGHLSRPAGSTVEVMFRCAAPDGHQATVQPLQGPAVVLQAPTPVRFTGGLSQGLWLRVPPLGLTGGVGINSPKVPFARIVLLGA